MSIVKMKWFKNSQTLGKYLEKERDGESLTPETPVFQPGSAKIEAAALARIGELCARRGLLYVVDTSFFPSIGAVNPALTAMANALRVGDHLKSRYHL